MTDTRWALLPTLVVRSAGFRWELLDSLRWRRTVLAADEAARLEARLQALRNEAPAAATTRLTRGQAARLRNLRPFDDNAPFLPEWTRAWNELARRLADVRDALAAAEDADRRDADAALAAVVADQRFRDALVCSHPGVYRDLGPAGGGRPGLRMSRQLASYIQRFAAKCETMSFFGPINYARVDAARPAADPEWSGAERCPHRRAYAAAWVWDALRARVLADPGQLGGLVPRRKTLRRAAAVVRHDEETRRVHAEADGRRTLREIADATGLDPAAAARGLAGGVARGVLACDALPDDVDPDPVRRLLDVAPDGPVRSVAALLDRYPAAAPDDKLVSLAELPGLVGAAGHAPPDGRRGKFYNDRSPIHEAAAGDLRLTVGGALAHDLATRVPAAIDLLAHAAQRTRRLANGVLARSLGSGRFPLTQVLRDCAALALPTDPWLTELVAGAVAAAPDRDEIDLAAFAKPAPGAEGSALPVLCSVDVLVATGRLRDYEEATTRLVIGDVHDAPLLTPWALQFHPRAGELLAERDRAIERALGGVRAVSVVARRTTGLPPLRFPGLLLELGAASGDGERVRLDELYVESDGEAARLRAVGVPGELHFHNGELDSAVHTALALPRVRPPALPDVPRLPRLLVGNVVLSRRRWRLRAEDLGPFLRAGDQAGRLLALRALVRGAGIPDTFFAKAAHERKPIYVDTAGPLLVDGLARLARGAARLTATEVLPRPDDLWLRDSRGRYAAELRCVYLKEGAET
ncbi:hypothetical protein [Streptomyces litchfieldiae]|uniref:Lantibiotic dehydratase n=1 Tax=Streptomyces litchfieldiae TaxID=3075543 RepID=A0ABU2MPR3_9ACTN|nr:hypothetical protein [Streptomyces sp. DSM 44938]MDT0343612.1 hypothetical protein [Streptomyces sp. DSM 44938]